VGELGERMLKSNKIRYSTVGLNGFSSRLFFKEHNLIVFWIQLITFQ
jgi:hypothetical protein